jgi:hypothetical protein
LVTVDAPRAIINWTPQEDGTGPINFLPSDGRADFVNSGQRFGPGYIVLNRILPVSNTRAVELMAG